MPLDSIIGHRGCAGLAPENTEAAIRYAAKLGVNSIEVDVALTQENCLVIYHDENLSRCSNGKGKIRDASWSYLQTLDTGSWFDARFNHCRILQLHELIELVNDLKLTLFLELKVHEKEGKELACRVAPIVSEQLINLNNLVISSFSLEALETYHELCPKQQIGCLFKSLPASWESIADSLSATTIHLKAGATPLQIQRVIARGYLVYLYTINNIAHYKKAMDMGVRGIFTAYPDRFLALTNP